MRQYANTPTSRHANTSISHFIKGALLFLALQFSCSSGEPDAPFVLLKSEHTGLEFENVLKQDTVFHVFNYMYFFNGGGIAAGDFNRDGLVDLYFTSNMGPNQLYLNEGDFHFRKVTEAAGVAGQPTAWSSGASVVDINHDGLLDIYVSQVGDYKVLKGHNQLFVCTGIEEGIPLFEDQSEQYGLDLVGFGTQATFFDYDGDGDLDLYQLNHSLHHNGTFGRRKTFEESKHETAGDRLLRNDGGVFTDVTGEAGIYSTVIGYGLGIVSGDINRDGWPDIYIGNDFHENDYLYINQQDGTFKEVLTEQMRHTSRFSMGVDMADINNDGLNEVISLDMLPNDPKILKASLAEDDYGVFQFKLGYGYNHQYARNNLQLNNGNGSFSEIGLFAGVAATDWSWAPLLTDFNQDGYKDLFISNGIPRRMNDIDYINFRTSDEVRYKMQFDHMSESDLDIVEKMPRIKLPNRFFLNRGDLKFEDLTEKVENQTESFSNGAVAVDLDNDGDLDLVVNNLEDAPFIYKNQSREQAGSDQHYLQLQLKGSPQNPEGIGSMAVAFKGEDKLVFEHYAVRGYQSSMLQYLDIGLGSDKDLDSLMLVWPDGGMQRIPVDSLDRLLVMKWQPGLPAFDFSVLQGKEAPLDNRWEDLTDSLSLIFRHEENPFVEFNREQLIPHMVSTEGPALATGDINGDGLEDVFVGGSKRTQSGFFFQRIDGSFEQVLQPELQKDSLFEDVDAQLVDIDGDKDLDLVIASGGNEYTGKSEPLQSRVYKNNGRGDFRRDTSALPKLYMTAACVAAADIDGDGDTDLFFGGRAVPWNYGLTPESYLLENNGSGKFSLVTEERAPNLKEIGLIKSGQFQDIDQDGDPDLLLAMEWGPLLAFENQEGHFTKRLLCQEYGFWNNLIPFDYDKDGDLDLIAGNLGLNSKLQASVEEPMHLYVHDFDKNGQQDQILSYYVEGQERPFATYKELTRQMPHLKKEYLYARDFASATLQDLFGPEALAEAVVRTATTFESVLLTNEGQWNFTLTPLPDRLQFAPLKGGVVLPGATAEYTELILAGNFYENNIEMGRYDADYGNLLRVYPDGKLEVEPLGALLINGQVRQMATISIGGKPAYILAKNNEPLQLIQRVDPNQVPL